MPTEQTPLPTRAPTEGPALTHLGEVRPTDEQQDEASFRQVLANGPFRALWMAQVCSQLAQNFMWIVLGAFVANQTGKATLVSVTIVSAMLAQLLFSGFAGVIVDRFDKRLILLLSNGARVVLGLLFVVSTQLDIAFGTTAIILLIFITNAVAQFFTPAEAAMIPGLVERRNLIAASSLFNITLNACQVIPFIFALILLAVIGIVPVLLIVTALYAGATVFVAFLPAQEVQVRPGPVSGSIQEAAHHIIGDVREALGFIAHDPGLRLTLFQINVAPTFLFIFGTLGLTFVQETFSLKADRAWILLLPAGAGLVIGALSMGRIVTRARKEELINIGLIIMGVAIAILGAVAIIVNTIYDTAGRVSRVLHFHHVPSHNFGLIPPAMLIALVIGLAMALSTIPAQTLVFERTAEDVRGRVLALQQLVGGAIPIIPLLAIAPLADIFGSSAVLTGLGVVIVLIGALSVHLDRTMREASS